MTTPVTFGTSHYTKQPQFGSVAARGAATKEAGNVSSLKQVRFGADDNPPEKESEPQNEKKSFWTTLIEGLKKAWDYVFNNYIKPWLDSLTDQKEAAQANNGEAAAEETAPAAAEENASEGGDASAQEQGPAPTEEAPVSPPPTQEDKGGPSEAKEDGDNAAQKTDGDKAPAKPKRTRTRKPKTGGTDAPKTDGTK